MTLSEAAQRYTRSKVAKGASRRTGETYLRDLEQLVAYLVNVGRPNDIREFTVRNLRGFVDYLCEHGIGSNTVRGTLSCFSSFATWAMTQPHPRREDAHLLDSNPVQHIERPKHVPPAEKWLTLDELRAVLHAAADSKPHERLAFTLVVDQPLRVSEWTEANVGDLSLDGDKVALAVKVKGGARRKKVLGDKAANLLVDTLRQREARPEEPLLLNGQGRRWSRTGFSEMVFRIAQRAGLRRAVRAHALRHAIASLAAHQGASVFEIAEMLNHSGLATAQRYIHGVSPDAALARVREVLHG